jgi:hypothetical protein
MNTIHVVLPLTIPPSFSQRDWSSGAQKTALLKQGKSCREKSPGTFSSGEK